jgi:hypothetical protein
MEDEYPRTKVMKKESLDVRFMRETARKGAPPRHGLERVGPGFYVDRLGAEYFYLTGAFPCVLKHLGGRPALHTTDFIVAVLEDLRATLEEASCVELMD